MKTVGVTRRLLLRALRLSLILVLPVPGYAQDARVTGGVTDSIGSVPPGVTGTAAQAPASPTAAGGSGEWALYHSHRDLFKVNFPGQPTIRDITFQTEYGLTLPGRVYSAEDAMGRYLITVVDYTNAERMHAERSAACKAAGRSGCTDRGTDEVDGARLHAAWNIIKRKGKLTFFSLYDAAYVEGYQVNLLNPDGSHTVAVILMHQYRLYIIEATAPKGMPLPLILQGGFMFVDKDGEEVYYERSPFLYLPGRPVPTRRVYSESGQKPQ